MMFWALLSGRNCIDSLSEKEHRLKTKMLIDLKITVTDVTQILFAPDFINHSTTSRKQNRLYFIVYFEPGNCVLHKPV